MPLLSKNKENENDENNKFKLGNNNNEMKLREDDCEYITSLNETEMKGKTIEDDLLEMCEKYNITSNSVTKMKEDKNKQLQKKIKEFNDNDNDSLVSDEEYAKLNLNIFNQFVSLNEIVNEFNSIKNIKDFFNSNEKDNVIGNDNKCNLGNNENLHKSNDFNYQDNYNNQIKSISKLNISNFYEYSIEINKLIEYFGINDILLLNLFCSKISNKKVYLFGQNVKNVLKSLAENNFFIMSAGMKVFEYSRYRKTEEICKYRMTYNGSVALFNDIKKRRLILNKSDENYIKEFIKNTISNKEVDIKQLVNIDLNNDNLNQLIENNVSNYYLGSCFIVVKEFIIPMHLGKKTVKIMIPDNVLKVIKRISQNL